MPSSRFKSAMSSPVSFLYRKLGYSIHIAQRLIAFAALRARLAVPLPITTVILGRAHVHGTGRVHIGEGLLIYPDQYFETQGIGEIFLGDGCVLSTGVHLVAFAGIHIGAGTMIGEYTSVRDANHTREPGRSIRDSRHSAKPIIIGDQVWIGRGAAILCGVTIGDGATVGANAVVTRDVPAGAVVAGVPAVPIHRKVRQPAEMATEIHT